MKRLTLMTILILTLFAGCGGNGSSNKEKGDTSITIDTADTADNQIESDTGLDSDTKSDNGPGDTNDTSDSASDTTLSSDSASDNGDGDTTDTATDTNQVLDTDAVCAAPVDLDLSAPNQDGYQGVDLLIVMDDSSSMAEEQAILATAFFPLINALVNNPMTEEEWPYPNVDDLRVAVTTTNMGLSYGGNEYDGGWPDSPPAGCEDIARDAYSDGKFVTDFESANGRVVIQSGVIPCIDNTQCPMGYDCTNGLCDGDEAPITCGSPQAPAPVSQTMAWSEINPQFTGPWDKIQLALTTACLAQLGTEGCGFEQQLLAAGASLSTNSGQSFLRPDSLSVVLIVSDEEDCSIESKELFNVDELVDTYAGNVHKANIVCGEHPEHLTDVAALKQKIDNAKGRPDSVLFAAIVGVPRNSVCEGKGSGLGGCANAPLEGGVGTMANPGTYIDNSGSIEKYEYNAACTRAESGDIVTVANPGMRYVKMAQMYGDMGYIYSICHDNWSPAMMDVARLIGSNLEATCFTNQIPWNPETQTADNDIVLRFATGCPTAYSWASEVLTNVNGSDVWECALPKIAMPLDCDNGTNTDAVIADQFGWFYCENRDENYAEACSDGIDNDGNGQSDCRDASCSQCGPCSASGISDPTDCPSRCRYSVVLTDSAREAANTTGDRQVLCDANN